MVFPGPFSAFFHNSPVRSLGIDIIGCGQRVISSDQVEKGRENKGRTIDSYALVVLLEGSGLFESRSIKFRSLCSGEAFFLFPGEWHRYGPAKRKNWKEVWFLFEGATADSFWNSGVISASSPFLKMPAGKGVVKILSQICKMAKARPKGFENFVSEGFFRLLGLLCRQPSPITQPGGFSPIQDAILAVKSQPNQKWNFHQMAIDKGMSYESFRKKFLKTAGAPPHRFLISERIRLAAALLASGESVKATCFGIGLEDPYHFSKMFKQVTGRAPGVFARSIKSWKKGH